MLLRKHGDTETDRPWDGLSPVCMYLYIQNGLRDTAGTTREGELGQDRNRLEINCAYEAPESVLYLKRLIKRKITSSRGALLARGSLTLNHNNEKCFSAPR